MMVLLMVLLRRSRRRRRSDSTPQPEVSPEGQKLGGVVLSIVCFRCVFSVCVCVCVYEGVLVVWAVVWSARYSRS